MSSKVYGASDDLIEFDGECSGEYGRYGTSEDHPTMVAFSDGTVTNWWFADDGIWHCRLLNKGIMFAGLQICTDSDDDPHSDILVFVDGKLRAWIDGQEVA